MTSLGLIESAIKSIGLRTPMSSSCVPVGSETAERSRIRERGSMIPRAP